jgi:Fur family ferric uptake transcriptional regulator
MRQLHQMEKDQFIKLFKQEKIDRFDERLRVVEIFLQTEQHVTASELAALVSENGHAADTGFVRETLNLMCQFGFARKNRFDNGIIRYEHRHLGQHHDHMVCTKCRRIVEFTDDQLETLQGEIAAAHGFHMLQHKMDIYGICSECMQSRQVEIPLAKARPGEKMVVSGFHGGSAARLRLMAMGLRVGDEIEVVTNTGNGHVVVALAFQRLVIGRGLSRKIMVENRKPD